MTPAHMGHPFLTQKQRLEASRARVSAAQPEPEPEPEPPVEEQSDLVASQITTEPNSFGVFWKYSSFSISSHNPKDTDPFSDIPFAQHGSAASRSATTESISSDLANPST